MLVVIGMLATSQCANAQKEKIAVRDSGQQYFFLQEQENARRADTIRVRKDGFYRKAKELSQRRRFLGDIYSTLFREQQNPAIASRTKSKDNRDQKFKKFNGRVIRQIRIQTLDVFGAKVYDTSAAPKNALEQFGNQFHTTSKARTIRNQLTFKVGDSFRSILISNNERVLRQAGYLVDVRILPLPTRYIDSIDILVVTQDIFTLSAGFAVGGVNNLAVSVDERNFLGRNHRLSLRYQYLENTIPKQKHNGRIYYLVPFITPNSFISAEAEIYQFFNRQTYRSRVFRDFLFATTQTAGSAELRVSNFNVSYLSGDTTAVAKVGQNVANAWLGRAFKIRKGNDRAERTRIVTALRSVTTQYRYKPFSSSDSNQIFRDNQQILASIGCVERDYFRDILINGYGRTEDIPFGLSATLTGGLERTPDGVRPYVGTRYGQARFLPLGGYINYSAEVGSFIKNQKLEQAALRLDVFYFSTLIHWGRVHLRQFARVRYVDGLNRFDTEFLTISSENGIRGTGSTAFEGLRSLVLNLETVLFLNFDVLSFKAAPFALIDMGWAGKEGKKMLDSAPYYGLGLGIRLYNERLAFNNLQLRLSYYPNVPDLSSPFKTNFARGTSFNLQDFAITQPSIVRYQ